MQTCKHCLEYTHECLCPRLEGKLSAMFNPVIRDELDKIKQKILKPHQRYECRLCGGDHKEVQCNDADFASREN